MEALDGNRTPLELWRGSGVPLSEFTAANDQVMTPLMDHIHRWDRDKKRGPWFNRRLAGYLVLNASEKI